MFRMFQILTAVMAFVAVLVSSAITHSLPAQPVAPPVVEWERTFVYPNREGVKVVQETGDGGLIMVGDVSGQRTPSSTHDVFLLRTDAGGNLLWYKTLGLGCYKGSWSVLLDEDGGFTLVGMTHCDPNEPDRSLGTTDVLLFRTNASGEKLWAKTFPTTTSGIEHDGEGIHAADGGYIVAGYRQVSITSQRNEAFAMKIDATGGQQWVKTYGDNWNNGFSGALRSNDGGYLFAGLTRSQGSTSDAYLVKVDGNGNQLWQQTYGGPGWEWSIAICPAQDGGYFLSGYTGPQATDTWLLKVNAAGQLLWQMVFGRPDNNDLARRIRATRDGGAVMVSEDLIPPKRPRVMRVDGEGNLRWQKVFECGETSGGCIYDAIPTSDGGYVLAGSNRDWVHDGGDIYFLKLAPERPQPPQNLTVTPAAGQTVVLRWEYPPADGVTFLVERRASAFCPWQLLKEVPNNTTTYTDSNLPWSDQIQYRVAAKNAAGTSDWVESTTVSHPAVPRWQLKIFDPNVPSTDPLYPVPGAWVDLRPCDSLFKQNLGTAVIVHGWNPPVIGGGQLNDWMLKTAELISERFNGLINILAWDWEDEATGTRADGPVPVQVKALSNALKSSMPTTYDRPLHLMGHSNGTLIASATALELLEPRQSTPGILHPHQLTLWDPPDLGVVSNLDSRI